MYTLIPNMLSSLSNVKLTEIIQVIETNLFNIFIIISAIILVPFFLIRGNISMYKQDKIDNINFALFNFFNFQVGYIIISFFAILGSILVKVIGKDAVNTFNTYTEITLILQLLLFLTVQIILYKEDYGQKLCNIFSKGYTSIIYLIKIFAYTFVGLIISNAFMNVADVIFPVEQTTTANQESLQQMLSMDPYSIAFALMIVFAGPYIEEFIFRYILVGKLLNRNNKFKKFNLTTFNKKKAIIAVITSALIFSSMHAIQAENLYNFMHDLIEYSGMGMVLASIYIYEDNIFYSLGVHMINNLIAYIAMLAIASL